MFRTVIFFCSPLLPRKKETYNPQLQILINSCFSLQERLCVFPRQMYEDVVTDFYIVCAQPSPNNCTCTEKVFFECSERLCHLYATSRVGRSPTARPVEDASLHRISVSLPILL